MTTSRQQFEAWASAPPFERSIEQMSELSARPGSYRDPAVELAWWAWKEQQVRCAAIVRSVSVLVENPDGGIELWDTERLAQMVEGTEPMPEPPQNTEQMLRFSIEA